MFVALDENGNRIYADDELQSIKCFCLVCGETLTPRRGETNRAHFAHKPNSNCLCTEMKTI